MPPVTASASSWKLQAMWATMASVDVGCFSQQGQLGSAERHWGYTQRAQGTAPVCSRSQPIPGDLNGALGFSCVWVCGDCSMADVNWDSMEDTEDTNYKHCSLQHVWFCKQDAEARQEDVLICLTQAAARAWGASLEQEAGFRASFHEVVPGRPGPRTGQKPSEAGIWRTPAEICEGL